MHVQPVGACVLGLLTFISSSDLLPKRQHHLLFKVLKEKYQNSRENYLHCTWMETCSTFCEYDPSIGRISTQKRCAKNISGSLAPTDKLVIVLYKVNKMSIVMSVLATRQHFCRCLFLKETVLCSPPCLSHKKTMSVNNPQVKAHRHCNVSKTSLIIIKHSHFDKLFASG